MSHSYHVFVHQICSNMDFQHISIEHDFLGSSPTLLTAQQKSHAFRSTGPVGADSRPVHARHSGSTTVVENRIYPQHPRLPWSLPYKNSHQSSGSGRVGGSGDSYTGLFSGVYSAKSLRGPISPLLSSAVASCKDVATSGLSCPLLEVPDAKPEQVNYAEATSDQLESGRPKALQSPFKYTPELVSSPSSSSASNGIQRIYHNGPLRAGKSSGYIYFPPTNPSDKTNQTLDICCTAPRRQLSYLETPSKPRPRAIHRSIGELRHEAEQHAENRSIQPRLDSTPIARPYHSEAIRSKSRLWLDLSEQKDEIKKAVSIPTLSETQR